MTQVSNTKMMRADRLSNLPDDLILHILSRMNIKYAVHTCVLSKRWTRLWTRVPTLNFNTDIFEDFDSLENFLYQLSIRYDASKLYSCTFSSIDDGWDDEVVSAVIDYAISNEVKELNIRCPMYDNDRFEMPSRVFNCQSLQSLFLVYVSIELPRSISSTFLTNLHLYQVRVVIDNELLLSCVNLESFIMMKCVMFFPFEFVISCPKLANLMISYDVVYAAIEEIPTESKIKISTPRLVSFDFSTLFDYNLIVSVDRCPALESVSIDLETFEYSIDELVDNLLQRRTYVMHLINFLKELSDIKYLTLTAGVIEILSEFPDLVKNLPSPFNNVKALKLNGFRRSQPIIVPPEVKSFLFGGPPMEVILSRSEGN